MSLDLLLRMRLESVVCPTCAAQVGKPCTGVTNYHWSRGEAASKEVVRRAREIEGVPAPVTYLEDAP